MLNNLEIGLGTIVGREHVGVDSKLLVGRPNQDAIGFRMTDKCVVVTVHDGCGSGKYSEVGARIGAAIVPDCIQSAVESGLLRAGMSRGDLEKSWEQIRNQILSRIFVQAGRFVAQPGQFPQQDELTRIIRDYFQFTIVGALVMEEETTVFSIGDGFWAFNGALRQLGPFSIGGKDNAPPYLSYSLINSGYSKCKELLGFQLLAVAPTAAVDSVLVATDGLADFIKHEATPIPGKKKAVGPVGQLWERDDLFSANPFDEKGNLIETMTGFFRLLNSECVRLVQEEGKPPRIKRELGLLPDDTTVACLRFRKASTSSKGKDQAAVPASLTEAAVPPDGELTKASPPPCAPGGDGHAQ